MTTRERFWALMNFQPFDRLPLLEFAGWWDQTQTRWYREGLPAELTDRYDICRHFGLDIYQMDRVRPLGPGCPAPSSHGAGLVASPAEYERIKPYLYPWPVVNRDLWKRWGEAQERGEVVLWLYIDGFFWWPRVLFGIERHLYGFFDQPELMHRMNTDLAEWISKVMAEVYSICIPDFTCFSEDMSYNHGPMIGQDLFDEFLRPYYRRLVPKMKAAGSIPFVDSDGDITAPAEWFDAAGIEGILPLERQAGVDVAEVRRRHPRMRFIGCFDKMTMDKGEAAMRAEFERLLPVASRGGLILSCDHQTPPGVSYQDYRLYVRLFEEYAREAGLRSETLLKGNSNGK
jgi:hypothetical protein